MMKVILIDDEPLALELLESYLKELPEIQIIGSYTNPLVGKQKIISENVDLVFLDINMPEITGIEIAEHVLEKNQMCLLSF